MRRLPWTALGAASIFACTGAAPAHAQSEPAAAARASAPRLRLTAALGPGYPFYSDVNREETGAELAPTLVADVPVATRTRVGARVDYHRFIQPRGYIVDESRGVRRRIDGATHAWVLSAVGEASTVPLGGVVVFGWAGPALLRYTGEDVATVPGSPPLVYPNRWSGGVTAGLGARHPLAQRLELVFDVSGLVAKAGSPQLPKTENNLVLGAARIGVSFTP